MRSNVEEIGQEINRMPYFRRLYQKDTSGYLFDTAPLRIDPRASQSLLHSNQIYAQYRKKMLSCPALCPSTCPSLSFWIPSLIPYTDSFYYIFSKKLNIKRDKYIKSFGLSVLYFCPSLLVKEPNE